MAMRSESRVEAEVEEEENYGPQPLCRLEVCILSKGVGLISSVAGKQLHTPLPPLCVSVFCPVASLLSISAFQLQGHFEGHFKYE